MKMIFYVLLFSCIVFTIIISCSKKDSSSATEDISISSSVSDNASVAFGQTYQYQVDHNRYLSRDRSHIRLSNQPDGMTISSSGLVEWTPNKASQITTHSNITITLTTASGYVFSETFDLTIMGTCTTGNVLAIWSGDQRTSTDSSNLLGNVTAYTDNESSGDVCGSRNDNDRLHC